MATNKVSVEVTVHPENPDISLFVNPKGQYWIGRFDSRMTHQNGEPLYFLLSGMFDSLEDGKAALQVMPPDTY